MSDRPPQIELQRMRATHARNAMHMVGFALLSAALFGYLPGKWAIAWFALGALASCAYITAHRRDGAIRRFMDWFKVDSQYQGWEVEGGEQ